MMGFGKKFKISGAAHVTVRFAALAKQWDAAFPYIKGRKLSPWIHAKSIQKACESYRITQEQKEILRGLK